MASCIARLTYDECPKTRAEFIKKFNSDHIFHNRAKITGFVVVGENVILPSGKVADVHVK